MKIPPKDAAGFSRWLICEGACDGARAWADGKDLATIWQTCECGDWLEWLLDKCSYEWTDAALAEYKSATVAAVAKYRNVTDQALAKYERALAPALAEYRRVRDQARDECQCALADEIRRIVGDVFKTGSPLDA